jgi:hypothetical protein
MVGHSEPGLLGQSASSREESSSQILIISASPRTDETCPSEMAKTFRIVGVARKCIAQLKYLALISWI